MSNTSLTQLFRLFNKNICTVSSKRFSDVKVKSKNVDPFSKTY